MRDDDGGARADRPWEAHAWLRAETLAVLAELNEQCLEMLALQLAPGPNQSAHGFVRETGPLLRLMDIGCAASCSRVSLSAFRCGVCRPAALGVGRPATTCVSWRSATEPPFFTLPQTRSMARIVFTYAWHLARSQNAAARLLLGMSAHCARLIAVCTLRQIHDLAETHPEWLQPRWATRPGSSGGSCYSVPTRGMRRPWIRRGMRGLQLMAAETPSTVDCLIRPRASLSGRISVKITGPRARARWEPLPSPPANSKTNSDPIANLRCGGLSCVESYR